MKSHSRAQARERDREREACGRKRDVADAAGDGGGEGKRYRRDREGRRRSYVLVSRGKERGRTRKGEIACVRIHNRKEKGGYVWDARTWRSCKYLQHRQVAAP